MKANIGGIDRIFRVILGMALIGLAVTDTVGWWGWLGIIPLATGLIRFCPLYTMLGFKTCSTGDNCAPKKQ
ncbi:MAG: DUF2892 domain-containing protein [Betaproteobacteria bacterium]|nr:DUF2892 domain-containing protein [Betaproteobacteria bacterium]